jgi:hypothetical protein
MSPDRDDRRQASYHVKGIDELLIALEEATRATPDGGPAEFVPPAGGELETVKARFHHFIFGRRGSGKTSLLRHLESELRKEKRPTVWIDQELFMELSYPDVLVSSVLEVMRGVRQTKASAIVVPRRAWWKRAFPGKPSAGEQQLKALDQAVGNLETLRHLPNDRAIEWTRTTGTGSTVDAIGKVRAAGVGEAGLAATETVSESVTSTETVKSSKEEYLERSLTEFRSLIRGEDRGGFVFLDEFYRVKRPDQPRVLGYMHRLTKDTGFWLKIASVRYWTTPYKGGTPPQGMQPTQDANEVSLDRSLQLFDSTKSFLEEIFESIAKTVSMEIHELWTDGALSRLVLASGGVPRDYLRLAGEAIKHARNRGVSQKAGSERVMAEDVNSAAGQTAETKLADLREDAPAEAADLTELLEDLSEFCRYNKVGYFLVDSRDSNLVSKIDQLQDLRFVHLLYDGETLPNAGSRRHRVFLLDVAYLSFKRARQVDFEGWMDRSKRRRPLLVYGENAGAMLAAEKKASANPSATPEPENQAFEPETIPMFYEGDVAGGTSPADEDDSDV